MDQLRNMFFNEDCIEGCKNRIPDNTIDLIITDPPYGIQGDTLHKHYNRKESFVIEGYQEIPEKEYPIFSLNWIKQAERVLKPGGSIYIVSGYSNLIHILNALRQSKLKEINHIIWKYNFGVYTKTKYISSHYHILFYTKPGKKHSFNTFSRFGQTEMTEDNRSLNYSDREDVWDIKREYKPGKVKNKNELPYKLLTKIIQYSSNEGDLILDLFLGGFSTAIVGYGLNRDVCGFEISQQAFDHNIAEFKKIKKGFLIDKLREPQQSFLFNQGKAWNENDLCELEKRYDLEYAIHKSKKKVIDILTMEFGRGRFSIQKSLEKIGR